METKTVATGFEVKNAETGEVEALVNTLDIVDRDGDVVLKSAIKSGVPVKLSYYEHDVVLNGAAPVGKGTIEVDGTKALFRGHFFMATSRGRDAFELVKALGPDSEWSIGFANVKTAELTDEWKSQGARRVISSMDVKEVSPVFIGANASTRTLSVKAAGSLTDRVEAVHNAMWARNENMADADRWYAEEVFDDHLIAKAGAKTYSVAYTIDDDGKITLGDAVEVEVQYVPVENAESKAAEGEIETPAEPVVETPAVDDAEAKRLAEEVETKAREDEARQERAKAAVAEFERVQRTFRRMGIA